MSFTHFTQSYQQKKHESHKRFWGILKKESSFFGGFAERFPQSFPQLWKTCADTAHQQA